jgi:delta 1-pyrroline-5-carboxylate dehydrogenase
MQVEVGAVYINKFQFGVIRPPEQYAGLSGVGSIAAGPLFFALILPCPHLRELAAADARPLPGQSARSRAKRPVSPRFAL